MLHCADRSTKVFSLVLVCMLGFYAWVLLDMFTAKLRLDNYIDNGVKHSSITYRETDFYKVYRAKGWFVFGYTVRIDKKLVK